MFEKWKAKRELVKAFKFYRKKYEKANKHYHHTFNTEFQNENYHIIDEAYNDMKSLEDILKALAYVLYSNFNMFVAEDRCWISTYYDLYKHDGKQYVEKIEKDNKTNKFDLTKPLKGEVTDKQYGIFHDGKFDYGYITTLKQGNIYFDIANNKQYIYDGKNLIEMC